MTVPVAWVASLLTALEPAAPWRATYEHTAEAIARAAESEPLFAAEENGEERTVTILVAVAWYESRFKPTAKSADGRSLCLYQVDRAYFPEPAKALDDPSLCTRTALKILRQSLQQCRGREPNERLAAFMSGKCDRGGAESRYRMFLANKLRKEHPMPPPPPPEPAPVRVAEVR
jgi:hypothetical protein